MNDHSDTTSGTSPDVTERADVLHDTLHLSPETARVTAENESASGMRKPGPNEVDEARAAEARATEPAKGGTPDRS